MNSQQTSAERDALLQALKRAETEITQARAAQQRAETKAIGLSAELNAERAKRAAAKDGTHPAIAAAQSAQKRAEAKVQHLEAQLRGQQMELDELQVVIEKLGTENRQLRAQTGPQESEFQALRRDAEDAKAEVLRLRALVLKAATGVDTTVPADAFEDA